MMTAKATLVLVLAYVLALAAGTTSGVLAERMHTQVSVTGPLAVELHLTAQQCDQMRAIWEKVSNRADQYYRQAQDIQQRRDQALYNMLTNQQKAAFAPTDQAYAKQFAAVVAQRQAVFRDALAKTEQMLNPAQRIQYKQIVRQRLGSLSVPSAAVTEPSTEGFQP
jgi:uncharacterized FlgJ-related protein